MSSSELIKVETPEISSRSSKKKRTPLLMQAIGLGFRGLSVISPYLASRLLEQLFKTPQKYVQSAIEVDWMADAQVSKLQIDGQRSIPIYSWGEGPIVLLVHGLSARASQLGAFVAPLREKGFRVVSFDAPAHGDADGKQTVLPEIADTIGKVARHLGPLYGILAHSNGAAATTIALSVGIEVEKITYISSPENLSAYLDRLAAKIGFSADVANQTRTRLENSSGFSFDDARGTSLAPSMNRPVLIIHDRYDRMVPFEEGASLAHSWPQSSLVPTEGLGHSRILRNSEVIQLVCNYMQPVSQQNSTATIKSGL